MNYVYSDHEKTAIKANPLNRVNCLGIRAITTRYYREFQAAERAFNEEIRPKQKKEAASNMQARKDAYETSLSKFKLYKELFPDLVK